MHNAGALITTKYATWFDQLYATIFVVILIATWHWKLLLIGVVAMPLGGLAFSVLLRPVERLFVTAAELSVPFSMGLRSRRPHFLMVGGLVYVALLFALWCGSVLTLFAFLGEPDAVTLAVLWSYAVSIMPFRAKDNVTPGFLSTHTNVARVVYLVAAAHVAFVGVAPFLVLMSVFLVAMMIAGWMDVAAKRRIFVDIMDAVAPVAGNDDEQEPLLTLFPTSSAASADLMDTLASGARDDGMRVDVCRDASQELVVDRCLGAGAVIFDATREDDDTNYRRAMYVLNVDYVVCVSRNYLPANFPSLDPIAPHYPTSATDDVLIPRVRERLEALRAELPRSAELTGHENAQHLLDDALTRVDVRRRRSYNVFVSYRGKYEPDVAAFSRRAESTGHKLKFLPAGALALEDELLSLQGRWQVLRLILRYITSAEEFWLFHTDDYYQSWWTQAELVLLAYIREESRPTLCVCDPASGELSDPGPDVMPVVDASQREAVERFLFFAHQPEWAVRVRETEGRSRLAQLLGEHDELFEPSFIDDPLLQCGRCSLPTERPRAVDVDAFLTTGVPRLYPVASETIEAAASRGESLCCPNCGMSYPLRSAPPRYWWYPERSGIGTGPAGVVLEERPTYCAGSLT